MLAAATRAARAAGAPDPVPVTERWPGLPSTDETPWQEAVIAHLGLARWELLTVGNDDAELLGAEATASLSARGVLFPALLHVRGILARAVAGGVLLDGEGGDEVLGSHRTTVLLHLRELRHRPRAFLSTAADGLGPRRLRARRAARHDDAPAWWTPRLAAAVATHGHDGVDRPLRADRDIAGMGGRHGTRIGLAALDARDAAEGVTTRHPLLEPAFLAALAGEAGPLGWPSRTALTGHLAGADLPADVISRHGKVDFAAASWGTASKAFARSWDGHSGIDPALVHPGRLREEWLTERPGPLTAMLLHAAWLAQARA